MSTTKQIPSQWEPDRLASLTAWYGKHGNLDPSAPGQERRILEIGPEFRDGRILSTLQDLFDGALSPAEAANNLASIVLADNDPDTAWEWMCGTICVAAQFQPFVNLESLANVLIHLAKLPHALSTPSYPTASGPGQAEFAYLPNFGFTLSDHMQGPRQYFCNI